MNTRNVSAQILSFSLALIGTPIALEGLEKSGVIDLAQKVRGFMDGLPECSDQNLPDKTGTRETPQCLLEKPQETHDQNSIPMDFVDCDDFSARADLGLSEPVSETRKQLNCTVFVVDDLGNPQTVSLLSNSF